MRHLLIAATIATATLGGAAAAQTTMPLNTGYNYATNLPYVRPAGGTSTVSDPYWMKIASYEPPATGTTVAPAWVIPTAPPPPWTAVSTNSRWIGPRPVAASSAGANLANPAYSLFRKCFCLMPGYRTPSLNFQVRSDDTLHVWLNGMSSTLVGPVIGNWGSGPARTGATSDPARFRTGVNCIYVLVEDTGGQMGFDLAGNVTAWGLMPMAAQGAAQSFRPCNCETGPAGATTAAAEARDQEVVRSIVRFAEERRVAAARAAPERAAPRGLTPGG